MDPARSQQIRLDLGQILKDLARFQPELARPGQKLFLAINPIPESIQPETDETWTGKSDQITGSVLGHIFLHPNKSGRVWVGHKPNLARPVDTPNCQHQLMSKPTKKCIFFRIKMERVREWVFFFFFLFSAFSYLSILSAFCNLFFCKLKISAVCNLFFRKLKIWWWSDGISFHVTLSLQLFSLWEMGLHGLMGFGDGCL